MTNPFFAWHQNHGQGTPPNANPTAKLSDSYAESLGEEIREGKEGDKARDDRTMDGRLILQAYSVDEVQSDGTQKEVWYVP